MKRRQDRLNKFDNMFKKLDPIISIQVIDAVDGRELDYNNELIKRINPWNIVNGKPRRYGVIGCCLSHLDVYRQMKNDNEIYLVFEDDVTLVDTQKTGIFTDIFGLTVPNDCGIIFLNHCPHIDIKLYTDSRKNLYKYKKPIAPTTEAYLIRGKFAKELIAYNENNIGAIDAHMKQLFEKSNFKQYFMDPAPFCQDQTLGTDIQKKDYPSIDKWCPTVVVNLKRRPDRLQNFNQRYKNQGTMPLTRKCAIDGKLLKSNSTFQKYFSKNTTTLRSGEIGCFLSHFEIWLDMIKRGLPFCCIYEDDVLFTSEYDAKLNVLLKELPRDFFIMYLGGRFNDNHTTKNATHVSNNIVTFDTMINNKDQDRTTHAYIISLQCARLYCDEIQNNPDVLKMPVDHFMLRFLLDKKHPILNAQPLINWSPMRGDSDIR